MAMYEGRELVGNCGPEYFRLLMVEKRRREKYFTIHMPTGALCVTDHTFAGGYGGGWLDFQDELIRADVPYEELWKYAKKNSPVLHGLLGGMDRTNYKAYWEKLRGLPQRNPYWDVSKELLQFYEFQKLEPLCVKEQACVYLCRYDGGYALVLEFVCCRGSLDQRYLLLRKADPKQETREQMKVYADEVLESTKGTVPAER